MFSWVYAIGEKIIDLPNNGNTLLFIIDINLLH